MGTKLGAHQSLDTEWSWAKARPRILSYSETRFGKCWILRVVINDVNCFDDGFDLGGGPTLDLWLHDFDSPDDTSNSS